MLHYLSPYLDPLDEKGRFLECDGMTRVISSILSRCHIAHTIQQGFISTSFGEIAHFWIALEDEFLIDYRARMWLGHEPAVPHGVFKRDMYPGFNYSGMSFSPDPSFLQAGDFLARLEGIDIHEITNSILVQIKKETS